MVYGFGYFGHDRYVFVYDDFDKSVKLELTEKEFPLIKSERLSCGKLRILGFELDKVSNRLRKSLCSYRVGRRDLLFRLVVPPDGINESCKVMVSTKGVFHDNGGLSVRDDVYSRLVFKVTRKVISVKVPSQMILYLLDVRSRQNFDELMMAFNNLLGKDIEKVIDVDDGKEICEVIRWC